MKKKAMKLLSIIMFYFLVIVKPLKVKSVSSFCVNWAFLDV